MSAVSKDYAALAASTSTLLESSMMEGDELYDPTTVPIANEEWSKKGGTSNLCRLCANTSDYFIPIFEGEGLEHELSEKIDKHLPIKVCDSDSLPIHVCYQCASTLIAWHDLLLNCVEAEKKLLQIQQQVEQDDLEESKNIEFDAAPSMDSDNAEDSVEATTPLVTPEEMEKSAPSTSKKNTSIKERPSLKRPLAKKSASSQKKARKTETEISPVGPEDGPAEEETVIGRSQDVSVSTGGQDSTRQIYSVWIQTDDDTEEFLCDIAEGIDGEGVVFVSSAAGKDKLLDGTQLPVENSHDWVKIKEELNNGTMIIDGVDDQTIFYVTPQTIKLMGSRRTVKWPPRSCVGEQLYECQFCLKSFRDGGVLLTHLRCHTGFTPFFCKFCGGKFKLSASLKHHLDTCLAAACAEATADVKKELHPLAKNEQGFFECNYCGKKFKFKANLKEHIRYHTGRPRCKQRCDICTKKFLRRHELLVHLTTDHLDITYMTCDTCNKICISERDLADHMISHSNERPFICLFCGRKFKRKSHLTRHETNHRYQQQGLRPPTPRRKEGLEFKCDLCGKNYSTKRQLQNHGFTHTGERNYECQHCGKRLGQFGTLKRHIRVVHEGIKDFVCELCQRSFTAKVSLTNHKRIHTGEKPFLCELCGKGFRTPQQMHLHERIHTNERPHSCPYCEKCFRRRPHLLVHIRTHTGEKPYECDVCRRGFAQKNDMKKHRVLHDRYRRYR